MPRRVSRALLVALAALAGCSLAGPDGSACTNSCHCHSSGSMGSPPLLGAAPPPPSLHAQGQDNNPLDCKKCALISAFYGLPEKPWDVTNTLTNRWKLKERSFTANCTELLVDQLGRGEEACGGNRSYSYHLKIRTRTWKDDRYLRTGWPDAPEGEIVTTDCCRDYNECEVANAYYGPPGCPKDVTRAIKNRWNDRILLERSFRASSTELLAGDEDRPWSCDDDRTHYLNITTIKLEDDNWLTNTWPAAAEGEKVTIIPY